jgi:putative transposase
MSVIKSYKFRIYPTKEQQGFLARQFGAARFIYNLFLAKRKEEYMNNKKSLNYFDDAKSLTLMKKEEGFEWLNDINSQTLQSSLRNLEVAYQNFFKKRAMFPKFHAKSNKQCIKIPQNFCVEDAKLYIPKLKTGIKIVLHRELPSKPTCCFISKTPSGRYYASFPCEEEVKPLPKLNHAVGIDLGIKSLLVTSDGEVIDNKNVYRSMEKVLAYEQRQLSKKKKGSKSREKQRLVVAKINEYIANCRRDHLHKVTKQLIDENQVIITESLAVKNMIKNHCLAKSIQDASWGELLRQLDYKAEWYGRTLYQIDRWFPSSKTCNDCQFVVDSLPLNIREWTCPHCKRHHDRDANAALNIRDKGLLDLRDLSGCGMQSDTKQKRVEASTSGKSRKALAKLSL